MNQTTRTLAATAFACLITSAAHAASIQSMTIEDIGVVSGGFDLSEVIPGAGFGDWIPATGPVTPAPAFFSSIGSSDGAILMGTTQANGEFTLGTNWGGFDVQLNTLRGAPSGTIENGVMSLDFSGLFAELTTVNLTFNVSPDVGSQILQVQAIDATRYYYTAFWSHLVSDDVYDATSGIQASDWNGSQILIYMEGIATLAPVPEAETYAMMLAGLALVGFMTHRRRKLIERQYNT